MTQAIAAIAPLVTALLFGVATVMIWRRRRAARHALIWSTGFATVALGWMVVPIAALVDGGSTAAPRLCWLASALLFVHGQRQRAGRRSRGDVLAAVWAAIAFGTTLLLELNSGDSMPLGAMGLVLIAIGLGCGAVAVGPRDLMRAPPQRLLLDWVALLVLALGALACLALAALTLVEGRAVPGPEAAAAMAVVLIVATGLVLLLVLNTDLVNALERLARIDPLTNIWNRRGFDEAAHHLLDRQRIEFGPIAAVAIADIDSFKSINDRFGHSAGDAVLVRFAEILKLALQPGDLLARLGGEEFALLAFCCDGPSLLARVERVRLAMADMGPGNGAPLPITASFGVAELGREGNALRDALERADKALYRAKSEGRNRSMLAKERPA